MLQILKVAHLAKIDSDSSDTVAQGDSHPDRANQKETATLHLPPQERRFLYNYFSAPNTTSTSSRLQRGAENSRVEGSLSVDELYESIGQGVAWIDMTLMDVDEGKSVSRFLVDQLCLRSCLEVEEKEKEKEKKEMEREKEKEEGRGFGDYNSSSGTSSANASNYQKQSQSSTVSFPMTYLQAYYLQHLGYSQQDFVDMYDKAASKKLPYECVRVTKKGASESAFFDENGVSLGQKEGKKRASGAEEGAGAGGRRAYAGRRGSRMELVLDVWIRAISRYSADRLLKTLLRRAEVALKEMYVECVLLSCPVHLSRALSSFLTPSLRTLKALAGMQAGTARCVGLTREAERVLPGECLDCQQEGDAKEGEESDTEKDTLTEATRSDLASTSLTVLQTGFTLPLHQRSAFIALLCPLLRRYQSHSRIGKLELEEERVQQFELISNTAEAAAAGTEAKAVSKAFDANPGDDTPLGETRWRDQVLLGGSIRLQVQAALQGFCRACPPITLSLLERPSAPGEGLLLSHSKLTISSRLASSGSPSASGTGDRENSVNTLPAGDGESLPTEGEPRGEAEGSASQPANNTLESRGEKETCYTLARQSFFFVLFRDDKVEVWMYNWATSNAEQLASTLEILCTYFLYRRHLTESIQFQKLGFVAHRPSAVALPIAETVGDGESGVLTLSSLLASLMRRKRKLEEKRRKQRRGEILQPLLHYTVETAELFASLPSLSILLSPQSRRRASGQSAGAPPILANVPPKLSHKQYLAQRAHAQRGKAGRGGRGGDRALG